MRARISPDITIAIGVNVLSPADESVGLMTEMIASRHPAVGEMDAYERVLGDAMRGDHTLFAREDYVEEAWRIVDTVLNADTPVHPYEPHTWGIVDPVLRANTPVYEYLQGTWGPEEVQTVSPQGGWHDPVVDD